MCQSNAECIEKNISTCISPSPRPLRLIIDFDSLSSRKKKSEITNKPIEPTQLENVLKAVKDGHMTVFSCHLVSLMKRPRICYKQKLLRKGKSLLIPK